MLYNGQWYDRSRSRETPTVLTLSSNPIKEYWAQGESVCGLVKTGQFPAQNFATDSRTETVWDCVTPDFKKRIAAGEIINNPFRREIVERSYAQPVSYSNDMRRNEYLACSPTGQVQYQFKAEGEAIPFVPQFIPLATDAVRTRVKDLAVTQSHANIDPSSMLALATAAESRKTIDSLAAISLRAYKIFKKVRKLQLRSLKKEFSPRELADRWMEMRYALRPLIYDAYGIVDSVTRSRASIRRTFRGYASERIETEDTLTGYQSFWGTTANWKRKGTYEVSARAGVLCDVVTDATNIYGVDQVLETLWELVPFSFVADWFANCGDTIAAWTPNAGVTQQASWVTIRETRMLSNSLVGLTSAATSVGFHYGTCSIGSTEALLEESFLERIANPVLSTFPQTNLRLDAYKLTDLGIMMRKVFR